MGTNFRRPPIDKRNEVEWLAKDGDAGPSGYGEDLTNYEWCEAEIDWLQRRSKRAQYRIVEEVCKGKTFVAIRRSV